MKDPPPADGENCVVMLHKLGPVKSGSYQLGVSKVSPVRAERQNNVAPCVRNEHEKQNPPSDLPERGTLPAAGGEA